MSKSKKVQNKRDKYIQKKKSKAPFIGAVLVMGVALIAGGYLLLSNKSDVDAKATAAIGQTVQYSSSVPLQQVKLPAAKVENGKVTVATLTDLKDKKFIWTEYHVEGKRVPLTAMVKPNGKVVVAVSLCEPCKSEYFRILGNKIICNACDTTWDLETFKGLSGACQAYPPEILEYTQNGDNLVVDQSLLNAWSPRV